MRIVNDYFMVQVDQKYESTKTKSGVITLDTAHINDTTIERYANKRIYGKVLAVPRRFSDSVIELIDPGSPPPRKYMSGEMIQNKLNQGYKDYSNRNYNCSTFDDFESVTMADRAETLDVQRFDKVYFDPRMTEDFNLLGSFKGNFLYKCHIDSIICVVRKGRIIPQGKWCLVEPDMESWDDILIPIPVVGADGKAMVDDQGNPVMKPKEQWLATKAQPKARALRGFIRYPRQPKLNDGDRIVYAKMASDTDGEWLMKIEDKEYYVIEQQDVIAKLEDSKPDWNVGVLQDRIEELNVAEAL